MPHPDDPAPSRRQLLAGAALGGTLGISALAPALGTAAATEAGGTQGQGHAPARDVYGELGVQRIINAAGTITMFGGSLMPPEVLAGWQAASQSFVNLLELQQRVGQQIAKLLGVEAALVTTGAAGGILLGTAAAVTYRDPALVERLPLDPNQGIEVIRQKFHRACYDNQITACGVRLVDVETREELERAIHDRTALMFSYNVHEAAGQIKQPEWLEVARRHNIPTLLDAAADTPPVEMLAKYTRAGFDMVVFSGGKAIRGPQDTGLLLGRRDLIEAAQRNTAPHCGNIGRGMKVAKEDMVAMWAAIRRFVTLDHEAEQRMWHDRIQLIVRALADLPTLTAETIVPPIANRVPHLLLRWDENRIRLTPDELKRALVDGEPSIVTARVHGTGSDGFLVSVFMLEPGEDQVVADRLREILRARS